MTVLTKGYHQRKDITTCPFTTVDWFTLKREHFMVSLHSPDHEMNAAWALPNCTHALVSEHIGLKKKRKKKKKKANVRTL